MGGFFGVVSSSDCVNDLFYGTDYHSHLGMHRGGLAMQHQGKFTRFIHDISNAQFRSKFEMDINRLRGNRGVGVISDNEDQPLIINSHLGVYAIVTVGNIQNAQQLAAAAFSKRSTHFAEMGGNEINATELTAALINQAASFEEGIHAAQQAIVGSCSMLVLTDAGIYAARDKLGRTPIIIGAKPGSMAATLETCAFPNLGYEPRHILGPGEIVLINETGMTSLRAPETRLQICAFLWVYYGYPASSYEGINVETTRYRSGACLARRNKAAVDCVAGIPDSGTGHALGFANTAKITYCRPFVKYTPTWPRSFMPHDQSMRDLVGRMKLIPINDLVKGQRLLFCEDSIVRGTQLKDAIKRLYDCGAREVHMRPACPPLIFGCKFLNFSRSRSEVDLAARKAIAELEGSATPDLKEYATAGSVKYCAMLERIRLQLGLTSLEYQHLDDLVAAIGLPKEKLCTYCWDGAE